MKTRIAYTLGFIAAAACLAATIALAALGSPFLAIGAAELAVLLAFISARERDAYLTDEDWREARRPMPRL